MSATDTENFLIHPVPPPAYRLPYDGVALAAAHREADDVPAPARPEVSAMNEQTWNYTDKSTWGDGPWQSEPDKIQWVDEATGLDCLIVRAGTMGHLCGYVGVSKGHPHFQKDDNDVTPSPEVHGGLTYAEFCQEGGNICHVPLPGRPERVWWLGFDCAHLGDLSPGSVSRYALCGGGPMGDTYRTVEYVRDECRSLARQLAGA